MQFKGDLHLHQEWSARLDRVRACHTGQAPFDWSGWRRELTTEVPPGLARLQRLSQIEPVAAEADTDTGFVARVIDTLRESADHGSCYTEIRFGDETVLRPGFMSLFRQAEAQVRQAHPSFRAEAVASLLMWQKPERLTRLLDVCISSTAEGLAGIDVLHVPYTTEADWRSAATMIAAAAEAGLGVTVHAGEFSAANIAAAARIEGVSRIGHATHAAYDPHLLELLASRGVTVEACLTANVLLGVVPYLEAHPLRRFMDAGIPVALGTDSPVRFGTSIEREYRLASALGLDETALDGLTRQAITAGFTSQSRKHELLALLDQDHGDDAAVESLPDG